MIDNEKLLSLIKNSKKGDLKSTFEIIVEFENLINEECYIDGKFNEECKDYIVDCLIKNMKKFKKI